MVKAVFLDRDGTLIADIPDLSKPIQVKVLPGVVQGLADLKVAGFRLWVVTNQSPVRWGLITVTQIIQIDKEVVHKIGGVLDGFSYCRHSPEQNCQCRKPKPGLILGIARDNGIDLQRSYMIGDRETDAMAGKAAGCKSILAWWDGGPSSVADYSAPTFEAAVAWILRDSISSKEI